MNSNILQSIFADCPMGIAHLKIIADEQNNTADYRFLEINKAFLNICGINKANLLEKTVSQLFTKTETTFSDWHILFNRIKESDKTAEFEYYFEKLQKYFQVHVYYTEKQFVTLMLTDNSHSKNVLIEQKYREEDLIEEVNANVTAIIEGTNDSIWAFDRNYNILYINKVFQKEFEASFGLKLEKGSNLLNALPEMLRPIWKPRYDKALSNEQHTIIDEIDTAKGKLYIQVTFNPIINNGKVIGGSCFGSNITERKQSEIALKQAQKYLAEKESQYRLIAENSTDLIYVYHLIPEPHYEYISPSCFQLTGYKPEEGYADPFAYHKFINTTEGVDRFTQFLLNPDQPTTIEEEWRKKDGTYIWVEQVLSRKFDENGNLVSFQSTVRDITKRKQAELELKTSDDIVQTIPSGLFIYQYIQPDKLILINGNPSAEQLTGLKITDWFGKEFNEIWPHAMESGLTEEYLKVMKTGNNYETEDLYYQDERLSGAFRIRAFRLTEDRLAVAFENITVRKQAEEIIKAERMRLEGIIKGTKTGTWEWNVQSGMVIYNKRWAEIIGYTLEEISPSIETWMKFVHPEDLKISNEILSKHFKGELDYYETEIRMQHKDGHWVWIIDRGKLVSRTEDGKPLLMLGTHQDITERKIAEEALKESEENLSLLIELAPDAFLHGDNTGNIIGTNYRAVEIFGYSKEELLLMNIKDFFPAEVLEEKPLRFDLLKQGITLKIERKLRKKDGEIIFIEMNSKAMPDGTYQSFIRDITDRKQAEIKLHSSEKKFRELSTLMRLMTDNMPDMLWAKNLNKEFIFTNKAICNKLLNAVDTEEPLGKTDLFFATRERNSQPDNPQWHTFGEICRDSDSITLEEMKPMQFDEFGNVKGNFLFLDVYKAPLYDDQGQLIGVVGSARDITERKLAEEALKDSESRLEFVIEGSYLGYWDWNIINGKVYRNKIWAEMLGFTIEEIELNVKQWSDLQHPDDREAAWEAISKHLNGETSQYRMEYRMRTKDGNYKWILDQAKIVERDTNGKPVRMCGTHTDISERKRAEEALRETNEYLNNLFNHANAPIIVWDTDFRITRFNKAFEEITGLKSNDILGKHIEILFPEENKETSLEFIKKALSGEYWKIIEIKIAHISGRTSTLIWNSANIKNPNGKVIATIAQGQDITERKIAEEALRESEERFKSLHNASFGGITIHDKGFILDCNQGLSEMTGYSTEELIGMNGLLLISEKTRNDVMNKIMTGYEKPYESIGLRKNGEEYPVRLEARNIYYKGKPVRSVEFRDITEIKRAEEELIKAKEIAEKNEEKFRKAVLTIPDAITINRLEDGIYITANNGFYKIFNYTENEVIGKSSLILNIWFDSEQRILYKSLLEKNGSIENFEARFITKTGNIIDCLVSSSIILIDGIKHTINITKDITYLKNIESQLISAKVRAEESESKFREMARLMPQIIFETDAEGKLTYANRQACIMLGYPDDYPLIGLNTLDFYLPEDRLRAIENIKLKLAGQTEGNNEYTMIKKDGTLLNVLVFSTPILKDNKPSGLRGVIVDISDRKRAENLLKENEKSLRELNAQKDKFFSIIAHDLKSPFNSILGFSQLLVEQIKEKDYDGIEEYAKIMLHSSEHAFSLLSNLLEWSQAQSGKIEFNPEFFELIEFIDNIIPIFDGVAKQKSINIIRMLPHNTPIYADKHMISTVLRNLINNAIKFTKQGGEIKVAVKNVMNDVVISVKDNGIGIAKNRIEKLFRIDESESTPGTANEKGTGLGLILCKEFVEKHNGKIWVESDEGRGSVFSLSIPAYKKL